MTMLGGSIDGKGALILLEHREDCCLFLVFLLSTIFLLFL